MSKRKLLTLEDSKSNTAPVKPYSNNSDSDRELQLLWKQYFNLPNGNLHPHIVTPKGDLIQDVNVIPPPHDGHHNRDVDVVEMHKNNALATRRVDTFVESIGAGSIAEAMHQIAGDVEDEASRILVQLYMWAMTMHLDAGQLVEFCSRNYAEKSVDDINELLTSIPTRFQSFVNVVESIAVCSPELKRALEWAKQAVHAYARATHELTKAFECGDSGGGCANARMVVVALINAIKRLNAISDRCDY